MRSRPGLLGFRISATDATGIDWPGLVATWTLAGELGVFDAGWTSDHLTDANQEHGGASYESLTLLAALAGCLPGRWVGVAVASMTFRHPAILAKAATVLDHVTGGRFILGLGAGWHVGEHEQFGIRLPALRERFDRFESAVGVVSALFSEAARHAPGVTLDDPFYPLRAATNEPPPIRPDGPVIWLGGQRRRGIALAARHAEGWVMPGNRPGDVAYFALKRAEIRRALETAGRDPDDFTFAGQLNAGGSTRERREARETALQFLRAGANHLIIGVPGRLGTDGLRRMAAEVALPVRDAAATS
jgi:alkanesulfonate monooxygenase SsuD/methylene tetrahydromethanopterin reductase-like flavin-dependent oxidoreductase (luciferase family)